MMDGIRRNPSSAPPTIVEPEEKIVPTATPTPFYPKKEELFISKEETLPEITHEKGFQKGKILKWILRIILLLLITTAISWIIFFLWKTRAAVKKMSTTPTTLTQDMKSLVSPVLPSGEKGTLKGQDTGRINILLMGAAGEKKPGGNLTDTIMVMSIDTKNKKVALLSLPRDFYVPIPASTAGGPNTNSFTKINSLYKIGISQQKGADLIKQAVEKITDIQINYYVAVDFDAFQKIVDNIGGVNIVSERDIFDPTYPGPNYSYETFSLAKGAHLLDGATALKYVRERHNDPEGDFGRAKRQQQVIQAVKNKMFSVQTLFNVVALSKVLDTLGDNIKTDMSFDDIDQFIKLSKVVDTQNINNVVVDAWKPESLLKVSHVMLGNDRAFILIPRVGNYSEIKDLAQNIFNQAELKRRQEMILSEEASIAIINQSADNSLPIKIKKLLSEKLGMKNVHVIANENQETSLTSSIETSKAGAEKIFTQDELIKKLPAPLAKQNNDSENDITIRLGNDLIETYKYEEDTMQDLQSADDREINYNSLN